MGPTADDPMSRPAGARPQPVSLLRPTDRGLYCEPGAFYVDPWDAVDRAVVTHAHGDHVAWGCRAYLTSAAGAPILRHRLEPNARIRPAQYGESIDVNGVRVSLHPAGHILGSSQIRIERGGEVWVVSGDYKTDPDPTCTAFEVVPCHTFITESTFGLPIYRWRPQTEVFAEIREWWLANVAGNRASIIYAYALGKAQRVLAGLLDADIGPIYTHGAVERLTRDYRESGIDLPPTHHASEMPRGHDFGGALVIAPPSAAGSTWLRRFGASSPAFASGWMQIRGARRRRAVDRGFVLSDHADWPALLATIEATRAERVWVTHGFREPVVRWLLERGIDALSVASHWEGEEDVESSVAGEEIVA